MRITKKSDYQKLIDDQEIIIDKRSDKEFVVYTPVGTSRETRKDIARWYYKKENDLPDHWDLDYAIGFKKIWMNGRNWLLADFKFE